MTTQSVNPESTPAQPQPAVSAARSLSTQIRDLMLECPSRQAFYEKIMRISADRFHASVARVDFKVGDTTQEQTTHDVRMTRDLANRFSTEYLQPLSASMLADGAVEPKLKRYERGNQMMTLLAAPIMNIADNTADGIVTLMLTGNSHRAEIVLPQLDGITSMASAVLIAKTQSLAAQQKQAAAAGLNQQAANQQAVSPEAVAATAASVAAIHEATALSKAAQFKSTKEFGYSIVNSLCGQLQAEQVIFGMEKGQRILVEAISGFADFKASSPGVAIVRQSMEECLDHGNFVLVQREKLDDQPDAMPIHQQWSADTNHSSVCSIPLKQGEKITGVISIRRSSTRPFRKEEIDGLQQMLSPYGAALRVVDQANRPLRAQLKHAVGTTATQTLQQGTMGRRIAYGCVAAAVLWFLFGTLTYRPILRTRVTAEDLRHFAAPFNGKLQSVHVRPGQEVTAGTLLVEFDTTDLQLQLNSLTRQINSTQVEIRQAMEDEDITLAALARSRINVLQTQANSINKQIQEAKIYAPSDGTVVVSDLEQRIGQMFPHGQEIFQFAADGNWLLEIEVPDDIANYVAADQAGTFSAASHPSEKQQFKLKHIDGAAMTVQDRNVFMAQAPLELRPEWMKSGMEGTARIETVSRPVWWVVMHRAVDWARMNFWF